MCFICSHQQLFAVQDVSMETAPLQTHVCAILDGLAPHAIRVSDLHHARIPTKNIHVVVLHSTDINECSTNNGGCAQNCHNTAGSYHCSCNTGYSLNGNGHSCNGE